MNLVATNDIVQNKYNTVLDRGLKIIVEKYDVQTENIRIIDNHTISFRASFLISRTIDDFSVYLDEFIRDFLHPMAASRMQAKDTIRMAKAPIDRGSG